MSALPQARKASILAAIAAVPPTINPDRKRLHFVTSRFVETAHFVAAVRYGWSDLELFSVCPNRCAWRPDKAGLVTGIAVTSLNGPKLIEIGPHAAIIESGTWHARSRLTQRRVPEALLGVVWWHSPELTGGEIEPATQEQAA